jgi:hypothetical protein
LHRFPRLGTRGFWQRWIAFVLAIVLVCVGSGSASVVALAANPAAGASSPSPALQADPQSGHLANADAVVGKPRHEVIHRKPAQPLPWLPIAPGSLAGLVSVSPGESPLPHRLTLWPSHYLTLRGRRLPTGPPA